LLEHLLLRSEIVKSFKCLPVKAIVIDPQELDIIVDFCNTIPSNPNQYPPQEGTLHMALTKKDIVEAVQTEIGFTRHQSISTVENLLEIIKSQLASGEDVLVSGFGKFIILEKRERRGRNPSTGEDLMLRPRKVVTFKCSGKMKGRINDTK